MALIKKKKKGAAEIRLQEDDFVRTVTENAKYVDTSYVFVMPSEQCFCIVRDGEYVDFDLSNFYGGLIYPFSPTLVSQGKKRQKRKYKEATIFFVTTKGFGQKLHWAGFLPRHITDPKTQKKYKVSFFGTYYVTLDLEDVNNSVSLIYKNVLPKFGYQNIKIGQLGLNDILMERAGRVLQECVEEYVANRECSIFDDDTVASADLIKIGESFVDKIGKVFSDYGLELTKYSAAKIIDSLMFKEI